MRSLPAAGRLLGLLALVATIVVVLLEVSCRSAPVRFAPATGAPRLAEWVEGPVVRVGLVSGGERASLAADSGVVVWEMAGAGPLRPIEGPLQRVSFISAAPTANGPGPRWRIQVGSLEGEAAAEAFTRRVGEATRLSASYRFNVTTGTYQVRAGEWASRDEALGWVARLAAAGFEGGWAVAEEDPASSATMRLLENGKEYRAVLVMPARAEENLSFDGAAYRGLFEVRASGSGGLTVVNIANIEDYLRGVVPNELSPQAYPQIEALKAQAVAARTYALRNLGQFAAKGFDICATAACQVYRGKSSEQPLTDRAVEETRGVVATYRGDLIKAMYTSTCGGHTEDVENVFEGSPVPYLKGVACSAERSRWRPIRGKGPALPALDGGCSAREAALLMALGVVELSDLASKEMPSETELRALNSRFLTALSRPGCAQGIDEPVTRRGAYFAALVGRLCWEERAQRLLQGSDLDYLLQLEDRSELALERERLAAAVLIHEELLAPFEDNTLRPNAQMTRGQVVSLLARAALRIGAPALLEGEFVDLADGMLVVRVEDQERRLPVDPGVRLFRTLDGRSASAAEMVLVPGDRLRLVVPGGRVVLLEVAQSRMGVSADRGSRYYRWEVRLTPEEVARGVAKYGETGAVRDLQPRRLGVSGRVAELAVLGAAGEVVLKGMAIRSALGLRENLFVIDRELAPSGAVRRFVFSGKGWGHGVGLCQVGAASLAQSGADYQSILKHYYRGIEIEHRGE